MGPLVAVGTVADRASDRSASVESVGRMGWVYNFTGLRSVFFRSGARRIFCTLRTAPGTCWFGSGGVLGQASGPVCSIAFIA